MAAPLREKRVAKERQKVRLCTSPVTDLSSFGSPRLTTSPPPQIDKHGLPPGIELVDGDNLREWLLDIRVLDNNPIYQGQTYRLRFQFPQAYPIEPPEVTFEEKPNRPIPIHPHIYSNGIICLDLLGSQGWSPVQSAESVCMSIQSMLTSNTSNERPQGDAEFVMLNRRRPRDIQFVYHDDTV
ncbi:ubiquitin-conjugating enzyme E2 W [Tolypocladium capitatum]|uniref:Ubiquitin-conjugating enzyme E2 W n=1 Tax=Tolypocladium capitatum TaxID=45235 RepID=A0A2K3Q418_9HYPO|nr:ubiquitin-conjugating enzyme E2 W [Tolypocladium capitatum]